MREVKNIYITEGGFIVLKVEDGSYHTVESFTDIETNEQVIRAFQGEVYPPIKSNPKVQ
jgi:H+/gluconate symporter-like permease